MQSRRRSSNEQLAAGKFRVFLKSCRARGITDGPSGEVTALVERHRKAGFGVSARRGCHLHVSQAAHDEDDGPWHLEAARADARVWHRSGSIKFASESHQENWSELEVCTLGDPGLWSVSLLFFVVDSSCRRYMLWYVYVHGLGRWK